MEEAGGAQLPNPSADVSHENSNRVHFDVQQTSSDHELEILVKDKGNSIQEVHLGFLKLHCYYSIQFNIKDNLGEDITADPLQNLHCRVTSCPPTEDGLGHCITISFHAHKDKLVKESLVLTREDKTQSVTLKLMARVLGKHKGTPMLKNGIKCVGMDAEADADSEQSDWQGFN
ncbi:adipose-secreted signaling protein-like [Watersipora subatra]|uniref:adipose-secreted signaling protein-like n=1 Tax=Watersipora subatra TaxID=2589382 RepID=UPI00355AD661